MRGGPPGADASGSQGVVFVGLRVADDAGAGDDELSGGDAAEGFGVGFAFGGEDAAGESIGRVVFQDGDDALEEDGAVVVLVVGQMDGAARDAGTARDHRFVDVVSVEAMSGEGRDEGGMDVQHAVAKVFGDFEQGKKPGQCDEVDAESAEFGEDRGREGGDIGEGLAGDDFTGDGGVGGALDAATVGMTRGMSMGRRPAARSLRKLRRVVPPPETSTATRRGRSVGTGRGRGDTVWASRKTGGSNVESNRSRGDRRANRRVVEFPLPLVL